ncbi:NADH-quinone oxidoreductase subunit H, partial [Pseudonocardia sp. S2-4]|nr:NADH-quinone oxidoreductase subunit H [Pseudonocardia humida]
LLVTVGIVLVAVLVIAFLVPERRAREQTIELASDFPVPPLDLVVPPRPVRRARHGALDRAGSRESG